MLTINSRGKTTMDILNDKKTHQSANNNKSWTLLHILQEDHTIAGACVGQLYSICLYHLVKLIRLHKKYVPVSVPSSLKNTVLLSFLRLPHMDLNKNIR